MKKNWLQYFLVFSTCAGILLLAFVNKKPTCIESKDIQVVSWYSSGVSTKVFSCKYTQDESSIQKMTFDNWKQVEFIETIAQSLEGLFFTLNKSNVKSTKRAPYQVFIFNDQKKIARSVSNGIYVSSDMLNKKNLEELFVKSWLQQKLPQLKTQFDLRFQMIVDFILYVADNKHLPEEKLNWLNGLLSIKSYCESKWLLLDHLQTCIDNQSEDLSFFGMRPVLFSNLIATYQEMPLSDQYNFLNSLLKQINDYTNHESIENQRSLSIVDTYIEKYKNEEKFLSYLLPNYVAEKKFEIEYSSFIYADPVFLSDTKYKNPTIQSDVVFINKIDNSIYLKDIIGKQFSLTKVKDINIKKYIKAENLVYLTAEAESTAELLKHKNQFDKVLNVIIKSDQDYNFLNLDSYLKKNIYEFMTLNKNVNFFLYHLDSLALDAKYKLNDHLTSFVLDKTYNSYYSNSALDKIKWKRTVN